MALATYNQMRWRLHDSEVLMRRMAAAFDDKFTRSIWFMVKMTNMEITALNEIDAMVRRAKEKHGLPHNPPLRDVFRWKQ